jgi:hypothetical protein
MPEENKLSSKKTRRYSNFQSWLAAQFTKINAKVAEFPVISLSSMEANELFPDTSKDDFDGFYFASGEEYSVDEADAKPSTKLANNRPIRKYKTQHGHGHESRAKFSDPDDGYQFDNGPAFLQASQLGLKLKSDALKRLPLLLEKRCIEANIVLSERWRMHTRRIDCAWCWIDRNWDSVSPFFTELVCKA